VAAPLTEEGVKAAALIILLVFPAARDRQPDGWPDLRGLLGLGFAAVENVFYFLGATCKKEWAGCSYRRLLRAGVFGLKPRHVHQVLAGWGWRSPWKCAREEGQPALVLGGFTLAVIAHCASQCSRYICGNHRRNFAPAGVLADWGGVLICWLSPSPPTIIERKRIVDYSNALGRSSRYSWQRS
jgi:hypothetical protein